MDNIKDLKSQIKKVEIDLEIARSEKRDTGPYYTRINGLMDELKKVQNSLTHTSSGTLILSVKEAMKHNQFLISGSTVSEKRGEHLKTYKIQ